MWGPGTAGILPAFARQPNGTLLSASYKNLDLAAADSNDLILYDQSEGDLFYDTNGSTAGGLVKFVDIQNGAVLTFQDFVVI